jgi:hypothetical protein
MSEDPIEQANELTTLARDYSREDLEDAIDRIPQHLLRPMLVELATMRAADLQRAARAEGVHFTASMTAVEDAVRPYQAKLLEQGQALERERRKVKDMLAGLDVPTIEPRGSWLRFWRHR